MSRGGYHGPLLSPLSSLKPGFGFCLSLAALILAIPGAVIKVALHFPKGRPLVWHTDDQEHCEEPESEKDRGCLEVRAHGCNSRPSPGALRHGLVVLRPSSRATVQCCTLDNGFPEQIIWETACQKLSKGSSDSGAEGKTR